MHPKTQRTIFVFCIMLMLGFSCLLATTTSSCVASTQSLFISPAGASCAAEQTVPPATHAQTDAHQAVAAPAQALLARSLAHPLVLTTALVALASIFLFWKREVEPQLTRRGPISTNTFLPYLFATHGM